jgi:DNA-binding MarR family transcriptional regulator
MKALRTTTEIKLNPHERKVLSALADYYGDFGFFSFSQLSRKTRLNRQQVRRAARSLARKGLAEFCRGLFTQDGEVAGSGYGCSREGAKWLGILA